VLPFKNKFRGTEAVIDDNCGVSKFYFNWIMEMIEVNLQPVDDTENRIGILNIKTIFLHYTTLFSTAYPFLPHNNTYVQTK